MDNPRQLALDLLGRVATSESYINLLLPKELAKRDWNDADKGLVQELSYGALRWQLQYDQIIDHFTAGKTLSQNLRSAIQLGLHQLFRMRIPTHAAINETVDLVKRFENSAAGLANAVLRNADRAGLDPLLETITQGKDRFSKLSIIHSHPLWIITGMQSALELDNRGDQLEDLLIANNEVPGVNLVALTEDAAKRLVDSGVERGSASPRGFLAKGNLTEVLSDRDVRVQDQGSQLVALAFASIAPKESSWLDMCSGPGGKSAVLERQIGKTGLLTCYEPNAKRAKLVQNALLPNGTSVVLTARGQDAPEMAFEAILLDAPCAGLGSLRRKPESRWSKTPEQLPELTKLQAELIDAAVRALKPGGHLMYATCSPLVIETNAQIRAALDRHSELELIDLYPILKQLAPDLALNENRKTVQLWPHLHKTDAMFMALLRKREES
ncbi:MAG: transcription antitermination factor NusB [Aquiluna sp.]|nr:transcription antitermination factor NusB [Aquiluna sp.]